MPRPLPNAQRGSRERLLIAQEAARLVRESGIHDLDQARRKAAGRLGIHDEALWPRQAQVEEVLREQQRLFDMDSQPAALRGHRESAVQAMQFLYAFHPRLAGAVLAGTADGGSPVVLHLHCDDTDAVQRFLHEQRIPAEARTSLLQLAGQASRQRYPGWEFAANGIAFELVVLPEDALRHPPVSSDDGRPLPRATLAQLRQLLETPSRQNAADSR
ncbi:MAG: hypothetical protein J0I01_09695 [Stenotrophomonas nitritireducens]|uniref:hypothetical protein n=1 Tax=Stenotrophomonas nitritireducens TaxID=83617 RepID=UPI001ACF8630|nr:hypothetical protein [Stenotrophomonas nitritireducens]MBN8792487.1 hypothetical protein [Stenotrophomonas nitritireducens]MBN8797037.1 hypothetical protein [Stenotrophomonas nitritireducens]